MADMGDLLWTPSEAFRTASNVARFMGWLAGRGWRFDDYEALRRWSVEDLPGFWEAVWQYFGVRSSQPYDCVLREERMPGAEWFPGARVNYIRHLLAQGDGERAAILAKAEGGALRTITWAALKRDVATLATRLRALGIGPGDRVVSYLPNIPEAAVAFFATASIGAVWSSCSPDFGSASVVDRFGQIAPRLLFTCDGYRYGGKWFDRTAEVTAMIAALPTLEHVVHVPVFGGTAEAAAPPFPALTYAGLMAGPAVDPAGFVYADTAFDDPLWVVYSSGTTGLPKPFVHGHGGILLEALKFMHFHMNLKPESRLFYFSTTGWVMWNILLSGLITGASIVLYDGHPTTPEPDALWDLAAETKMTFFGASPAYLGQQMKLGLVPRERHDLSHLDSVLLGGSPVMPEHMVWLLENVGSDLWITSQSGGTDVSTGFVGATPLQPVYAGEIQTRTLGADVHAFDDEGRPVVGRVGELVVCKPMPSMPLRFWNDADGRRYFESYFDVYPGVWRHGDYLLVNERGGCRILGRSDSTLNRHGVRIGTAEVYRTVEGLAEVQDSLIVNLDLPGGGFFMPLFVVPKPGFALDAALEAKIRAALKETHSPRHVPDRIYAVEAVPYTLTGKKLEVPVRKILLGADPETAASRDAMANPAALDWFVAFARAQTEYALG